MTTPAKRIIKVDRKAPSNTPKLHTDTRGDWVFDKEVSKIRRAGYDERMGFQEKIVKKKVKTPQGEKFKPVPVTETKVSRKKWAILQEIRLRNNHD